MADLITVATDVIAPEILTDAIQGRMAQKSALMSSALTSSGAISIQPTFPGQGQDVVGQTVKVPYFGTMPEFVDNPDGSSIDTAKLGMTSEDATVARSSAAYQASAWARGSAVSDPYAEAARQTEENAVRRMEELMITSAATSPLLVDLSSLSADQLTYEALVYALAESLGDDFRTGAAIAAHPLTLAGLATQRDANGNFLYAKANDGTGFDRLFGIPVVGSSRTPKTGTVMGSVVSTGTSPPVMTITGTPLEAFTKLVVECVVGGAHETATIRFSTNGGLTWSANLTTAAVDTALALTDTAVDSLVGVNGKTGLSVAFAAGTFNADNDWTAYTNFTTETQVFLPNAGVFWYNRAAMQLQTDKDIIKDASILAMHLYGVAHTYRRRQGGHTPGVVRIKHKVRGFRGVAAS
jgi:hypothetical protein